MYSSVLCIIDDYVCLLMCCIANWDAAKLRTNHIILESNRVPLLNSFSVLNMHMTVKTLTPNNLYPFLETVKAAETRHLSRRLECAPISCGDGPYRK